VKREKGLLSVIGLIMVVLLLTSCSSNAQVEGVLVTYDGEPLQKWKVELWLATTESGEFEGPADLEFAYEAHPEDSGAFAFTEVQPGNYALNLWWLPGAIEKHGLLCITPDSEAPEVISADIFEDCSAMFVIEVEKGQEIDLGEILVRLSP
jgi:hypothetical protein